MLHVVIWKENMPNKRRNIPGELLEERSNPPRPDDKPRPRLPPKDPGQSKNTPDKGKPS